MSQSNCPSLYQIDTRLWISRLSEKRGAPVTLDDIPNSELDKFHRSGFQWIWLTNIWQRGSDLRDVDEAARFAISCYQVDHHLGGDTALARLRKRLQDQGLRLALDFEANHSAIDHEWIKEFPEYYVRGN
ncbi:MAG TPA: alpha-amylase family glycosyl hydrolase, partial [Chitinophagaceae bacterium]|nr:alpha-amylase family glycosyl hydrolase [Chitinophagaceae bacterium]